MQIQTDKLCSAANTPLDTVFLINFFSDLKDMDAADIINTFEDHEVMLTKLFTDYYNQEVSRYHQLMLFMRFFSQ